MKRCIPQNNHFGREHTIEIIVWTYFNFEDLFQTYLKLPS